MSFPKLSQHDIASYAILHITEDFDSVSDFNVKPVIRVMSTA